MDGKDWWYVAGGLAASAAVVGGGIVLSRRRSAASGTTPVGSVATSTLGPVTQLTAAVQNGVLTLSWQPPQSGVNTAAGAPPVTYTVVVATSGTTLAKGITATALPVTKLVAGSTYLFGVTAVQGTSASPMATVTATVPTPAFGTTNGSGSQTYGESLSGKITPQQALQLLAQGKIAGSGWVLNGEWFQNLDQIPTAEQSQASPNSAELAAAVAGGLSSTGEGGTGAYVQDVLGGGVGNTASGQQGQDAALYQKLGIIPSSAQVASAASETQAEQSGIRALQQDGASNAVIENYLEQLYGYAPTVAAAEAAGGYPVLQQTTSASTTTASSASTAASVPGPAGSSGGTSATASTSTATSTSGSAAASSSSGTQTTKPTSTAPVTCYDTTEIAGNYRYIVRHCSDGTSTVVGSSAIGASVTQSSTGTSSGATASSSNASGASATSTATKTASTAPGPSKKVTCRYVHLVANGRQYTVKECSDGTSTVVA